MRGLVCLARSRDYVEQANMLGDTNLSTSISRVLAYEQTLRRIESQGLAAAVTCDGAESSANRAGMVAR